LRPRLRGQKQRGDRGGNSSLRWFRHVGLCEKFAKSEYNEHGGVILRCASAAKGDGALPESRRPQRDDAHTGADTRVRNGGGSQSPGNRGRRSPPAGREGAETRVLVADDAPTRAGVKLALERNGFFVCAEAADAQEAVRFAVRDRPDLCLLEAELPGNGIAAAAEISKRVPETAIVVFTAADNDVDLVDAIRAGATGYLTKDIDPARLPLALRAALRGEAAVSRALVSRLFDEIRRDELHHRVSVTDERGVSLTRREWEVLDLAREGLTTAEIGERLFVTPETVRTHIASAMRKLQVPDRESAFRLLETR
jgi:DNA-binding NarL/FixJ family response regulator